jgi:Holliday junction DNA helicase RuvA
VLELKDRIGTPTGVLRSGQRSPGGPGDAWRDTVRGGLLGLGWSAREADAALDAIAPLAESAAADGAPLSTAALLRAALQSLSRA